MKTPKLEPAVDFSSFLIRWREIVMISPANGLITRTTPLMMKMPQKTKMVMTSKTAGREKKGKMMMRIFIEIYSQ